MQKSKSFFKLSRIRIECHDIYHKSRQTKARFSNGNFEFILQYHYLQNRKHEKSSIGREIVLNDSFEDILC